MNASETSVGEQPATNHADESVSAAAPVVVGIAFVSVSAFRNSAVLLECSEQSCLLGRHSVRERAAAIGPAVSGRPARVNKVCDSYTREVRTREVTFYGLETPRRLCVCVCFAQARGCAEPPVGPFYVTFSLSRRVPQKFARRQGRCWELTLAQPRCARTRERPRSSRCSVAARRSSSSGTPRMILRVITVIQLVGSPMGQWFPR